jgi:hypothetical protein
MDIMADDPKEAGEFHEQPAGAEQEPDVWDWARAAGVSREDLLKALEASRAR